MNKIFFCFVLLLFGLNSFSQSLEPDGPPILTCVEEENPNDNRIEWINNHNCGPNFTATDIYESDNPNSGFTLKKSVTNSVQVLEVLNSASSSSYYYLVTRCVNGASLPSDTIGTIIHESPNIRSASILSGSTVTITWEGIDKSDVQGYFIYRIEAQGPTLIDSVFVDNLPCGNAEFPCYEDVFATPDIDSEEYSITVFDRCNNKNSSAAISTVATHQTIFLKADYDSCSSKVELSWTPYEGWDSIKEYRIFKNFDPIDVVPGNQFTYEYTIAGNDPTPLIFELQAIKGSGLGAGVDNSKSNEISVNIGLASLPTFIKLRNVSVVNEGQIQVDWFYDATGTANNLYINRGADPNSLSQILNMGPLGPTTPVSTIDNSANTSKEAYYYHLSAQNDCGVSVLSDTARTIHLAGNDNFDLSNGLSWNKFELKDATVVEYVLQRKENGSLIDLAFFGPNEPLEYIDDVSNTEPDNGSYCYRIDCKFELTTNLANNTFSNEVCINQTSRMFVPSAFSPNGVNKVFKPVFLYPNNENYSMVVFTKWGEVVFESNDTDIGWDGTIGGELAPQGVYAYVIQMQSTNGNTIPRKGTVLLLR